MRTLSLTRSRLLDLLPAYVKGHLGSEEEDTALFIAEIGKLDLRDDQLVVDATWVKRRLKRESPWEDHPGREFHVDLIPDGSMYGHEIESSAWTRIYLLGSAGESFFLQSPATPYIFQTGVLARRKED